MKEQNPKTTVMLSSMVLMVVFLTASPCSAGWWDEYMVHRNVGENTEVVEHVELPGAPWGVQVINRPAGRIVVSWGEAKGATSYEVWRIAEGDSVYSRKVATVESTSYHDFDFERSFTANA